MVEPTTKECCATCRFWDTSDLHDGEGPIDRADAMEAGAVFECRRRAPVATMEHHGEAFACIHQYSVRWPQTGDHEWCGEWERYEETQRGANRVQSEEDELPKNDVTR